MIAFDTEVPGFDETTGAFSLGAEVDGGNGIRFNVTGFVDNLFGDEIDAGVSGKLSIQF